MRYRKIENNSQSLKYLWVSYATPPIIFLVVLIAASVYFSTSIGGNEQAISESVTHSIPLLLLLVQLSLLVLLFVILHKENLTIRSIGWRLGPTQELRKEIAIGIFVGASLAILYIFLFSPLLTKVQQEFGDYVPPGELLTSLGTLVIPFFIANVVLAPFVEESIYRGYGITRLKQRFSPVASVVISCVFFGLLHWAGGFWYIVLTGVVAGGALSVLFEWRNNVITPFVAHLTLNVLEFFYVWLGISH